MRLDKKTEKMWRAAIYIRISKETDEDTLDNQRSIILDHIMYLDDVQIYTTKVDDGYSGLNCNRPAFQEMLSDLINDTIDCVIVRDLSRFSRNHIDAERYLTRVFSQMDVRFISVMEQIDTISDLDYERRIMMSFRNLINDAYSADLSNKIRGQLLAKCKQGDFIGSFACYGYQKSPNNNNLLIIDEYAASIVNQIFSLKMDGLSNNGIAHQLNREYVLSPMDYKRANGAKYTTPFKTKRISKWTSIAVSRILSNEVYIGVLVQGKRVRLSYKLPKRIEQDKSQWIRVEGTHEAIVDCEIFSRVQMLLERDTHVPAGSDRVSRLCGMIFCADCGFSMVQKTVSQSNKRYKYYVCSKNRTDKSCCSSHSISKPRLEKKVFEAIKSHLSALLHLEKKLNSADRDKYLDTASRNLFLKINEIQREIDRCNKMKSFLESDFREVILTKDDYLSFYAQYDEKIEMGCAEIANLNNELSSIQTQDFFSELLVGKLRQYQEQSEPTRRMIVELIDIVSVNAQKEIEIQFRFQGKLRLFDNNQG